MTSLSNHHELLTPQTVLPQESIAEYQINNHSEVESAKLLDVSMMGYEDDMPRVYTETAPSLQARDYKEPRMILECKRLNNENRNNRSNG